MLFEKDKLQVGTDGFINSKRGRVELNEFHHEVIQWVLQIKEIKTKIKKGLFKSTVSACVSLASNQIIFIAVP